MERAQVGTRHHLRVIAQSQELCADEVGLPTLTSERRRTVILVALDWTRSQDPRLPLGHASLLAALHAEDRVNVHGLSYALNQPGFRVDTVLADVLRLARGLPPAHCDVAVGVYVWNEQQTQTLLRELRRGGYGGRIILGGPQISYSGRGIEVLYPEADVFVRGYGEAALVALTATAERVTMTGVHVAGEPDREEIARVDLRSLPSPFLSGLIELTGQRFVRWESQRGCPYRCSFCQHREPGSRLRRRALAESRLREEIALFARQRVERIAVLDPIFNIGKHAISVLDDFRKERFQGELSLQCRFELVTPEFLDACLGLNVCLEFGLQTAVPAEAQLIERPNDLEKVRRVCAALHARDIPFEVSLIYGLPTQTLSSFLQSIDFCLQQRVPTVRAFPLMLLRGTQLERERQRWGLIESHDPIPAVIASDSYTESDFREMTRAAGALQATVGRHPQHAAELLGAIPDADPAGAAYSPPWLFGVELTAP